MAEPFDSNGPGDETRRYAQYYIADAGEDLYPGEVVTINANGNAERVGDGDRVDGVVYAGGGSQDPDTGRIPSGEQTTVKVSGAHIAKVASGVSEGDGAGDGAADGMLSGDGDDYVALETGTKTDPRTGNDADYAHVVKR